MCSSDLVKYPHVVVSAGGNGWLMRPTTGIAHVVVTVQSLFDGTVAKRSTNEPFNVSLSSIDLPPGGKPRITLGPIDAS